MGIVPSNAVMRAFGHAADLDLDFDTLDRPGLVTTLLAQCGEPRDPAFWWVQPVSRRTAALLRLVAVTEAREDISLSARCAGAGCGEAFEFELPLAALPGGAAAADPIVVQLDAERSVQMRRPTGEDLRRWRDVQPLSRGAAVRVMLETLVIAGSARPGDESALSAALTMMDPLVAFSVACRCPACGASNEVALDLETLVLARLAARQHALLQDVHCIATRYGWTEAEVLAVPPARRARYLALIEDAR